MEDTKKNNENKKLSVPATILLTIAATFGAITVIGIIYAIFTVL